MDKENEAENVIQFPVAKRITPANSMEEVHSSMEAARVEQIELIVENMIRYNMNEFMSFGYEVGNPICMKNQFLLMEAMKGLLYKATGIHHPIHDMTESMFDFTEVGNDNDEILSDEPA